MAKDCPRFTEKPVTLPDSVTETCDKSEFHQKTCDTCGCEMAGYGKECPACRKRRSRGKR